MGVLDLFNRKQPKGNWVAVFHYWFQDTITWEHDYIYDATHKEAMAVAALKKHKNDSQFRKCDFHLVPLPDTVVVIHQQALPAPKKKDAS